MAAEKSAITDPGQSRLFVVDNGTDSAIFSFTSAGNDALVSAAELTLIGTLSGAHTTALVDYQLIA